MNRTDSVRSETAILVRLLTSDRAHGEDPLAELAGLAETAGVTVVGSLTQKRDQPVSSTYLG
ncbi:MAG: GTPase HflX, partial [Pirellulaceae bacterium]|nr:GTPase HflX [Pirellulaceae bacterium]